MANYRQGRQRNIQKTLILCGGQTEAIYINAFIEKYQIDKGTVKVQISKGSSPQNVVQQAIKLKSQYSEIWCLFDKDDFPDFDDAIATAQKHRIHCAFSNIAIEYWFVLHFRYTTGALTRVELNREVAQQTGIKEYNKNTKQLETVCNKLLEIDIETVENRARKGYEYHKANLMHKCSECLSCTTLFLLTEKLRMLKTE